MKIALAQLNPTIGDLEGNSRKIIEACQASRQAGADLVVFSELILTGYPPRDLLFKPDLIDGAQQALDRLITQIEGPAVVMGTVGKTEGGAGKSLTNSAVLFQQGRVLARADKVLLPSYDVFDETRYFQPGDNPVLAEWEGCKIGITVCEDIWNFPEFYDQGIYRRNPVAELAQAGAQVLINISASPYRVGRWQTRMNLGQHIAQTYRLPVVLVNQVGGNDDLLFDGHSFALSGKGDVTARAHGFQEDLVTVELETGRGDQRPIPAGEADEMFRALVMGVRDYLHKCGYSRAVIGLSGGIDSSVVAAIAAEALGAENVAGISMPSQYTVSQSETDAEKLAKNLGIEFSTVAIQELFEAYKKTLNPMFPGRAEDTTEENIQARIRGNILMAVSNKLGHMVLSTGNKSEMSVGYCTLYGDMAGGLSVISDVPKMKVYQLARWINRDGEVIPQSIIDRPPTAELRPNQTDQDSLPPYGVLDPILEGYVEQHLSVEQLIARGFEADIVRQVVAKVENNEYKRNQAAPGLKVTAKAFGTGRRNPIAKKSSGH
ncbi:MAG: NAD+ synthase [Nitrospinaceae bacterium]|nr:NAD+ synthase [Nitrospinaceae bacterium]NIR53507.1 NAD+ synthase [Nitrospinaceae bacterium]NIS83906.1 NAD+ synthase [Nitrospinaceae bacterium]NIT80708.1 NAD+ synthase [Nitrospinaceae bacterium]NIU43023.1 NAD+ synthase [Nitrospinaceae bacterium]